MRNLLLTNTFEKIKGFLPAVGIALITVATFILAGGFFFFRGQEMMETQLKDKLRNTAAAAVMQFSGEEIGRIKTGDTVETSPLLRTVVQKLQRTREGITNIQFAHIMKRTGNPDMLVFVADADLAQTPAALDRNKNGIVDDNEQASRPGDLYDVTKIPALQKEAFLHPTVDSQMTSDQWGKAFSGYAPILNAKGQTEGILGLDMSADEYVQLSQSIFSPVAFLLTALAALCIGGSSILFLWKRRLESLEKLENERSGLLRLAFHQIGGPLTIISWSLQELEESGPESIQRTIINIEEGVKRLKNILKTLKDADLVHADKIEYKPEFGSLTTILKDVAKDAGMRLAARKQNVQLELTENITMRLDPKLIAGVATELLTNAIDFSPVGGRIVIRTRTEGSKAVFEIEDDGCGIPKKDLSRIFDEFTRGSNATKYKADGNGLGLYIVNGIIKRFGGTITVKSEEGKGTRVTVRLLMA